MTPQDIESRYPSLVDDEETGSMSTFLFSYVMKVMAGYSSDVVVPLLEAIHDRLAAGTAEAPGVAVLACPDGPHGPGWHKALIISVDDLSFVAVLEMKGMPNPLLDAIVAKHFSSETSTQNPPQRKQRLPGKASILRVFCGKNSVEQNLAAGIHDQWSSGLCFEARTSYCYDSVWHRSHADIHGRAVDTCFNTGRRGFFHAMSEIFQAAGLAETALGLAKDVGDREYDDRPGVVPSYDAATALAAVALDEDGFIPGSSCMHLLDTLQGLTAEREVPAIVEAVGVIRELLADPRLCEGDGRFLGNDLDDSGFLDGDVLVVSDQNSAVRIAGPTDGVIRLVGRRQNGDDRVVLDVSFTQHGGGWKLGDGQRFVGDGLRTWNSCCCVAVTGMAAEMRRELRHVEEQAAAAGPAP